MSARPGFIGGEVWELERPKGRLVAGEREYKGNRFFEVRLWTGERGETPTGNGVTLPPGDVRGLAEALKDYADKLDADAPANGT